MTIGEKNLISFAFEKSVNSELIDIKFYLGGNLISDEGVYLKTYTHVFQGLITSLNNKNHFRKNIPIGLSNEQLYHKVKDDQGLDFLIDETIDAYHMKIIQQEESVRIVWLCWDQYNCNVDHKLNEIYGVRLPIQSFSSLIQSLVDNLTFANNT